MAITTSGTTLTFNDSTTQTTAPVNTNANVNSVAAGTGISVNSTTGAVTVTNSGVTSVAAGTGISVSGSTGGVTITNSAPAAGLGMSGQTWQNVTASRAVGTTYTNSTGYPIFVAITLAGGSSGVNININGTTMFFQQVSNAGYSNTSISFIVPNGATYALAQNGGSTSLSYWSELR